MGLRWHGMAGSILQASRLEPEGGMALSSKTAEAGELARSLARPAGESMTEAVTVALRRRPAPPVLDALRPAVGPPRPLGGTRRAPP